MDNLDQEVVREPFEAPEEFIGNLSPGNECTISNVEVQTSIDGKGDPNHNFGLTNENNLDEDCMSSTSELSLAGVDEADFAKSFGINLKTKNVKRNEKLRQRVYDKLMKSKHLISSPTTSTDDGQSKIKTSFTTDCIYHRGTFYQKGDIVAIHDYNDGKLYFAQLTGFLQDQYCEKSASLNWLVPIRPTSRDFFDPSAYRIGLEDSQLRKLDCMTFVRHCPHDYYLRKLFQINQQEYHEQLVSLKKPNKYQSYIWTTMEPCPVPRINTNTSIDEDA